MRKTTVNVSESLDQKIVELQSLTDHGDFIRIIEAAVYNYLRMVKSSGMYAPIYTLDRAWIDADKSDAESDTYLVDDGYNKSRIRKAKSYQEILEREVFYIQVKEDDLVYPYAKFDYEEVKPPPDDEFWGFV